MKLTLIYIVWIAFWLIGFQETEQSTFVFKFPYLWINLEEKTFYLIQVIFILIIFIIPKIISYLFKN